MGGNEKGVAPIPCGNSCDAAEIISCYHADDGVVIYAARNSADVVFSYLPWFDVTRVKDKFALIRELAKRLGYRLVSDRTKTWVKKK